MIQDSSGTIWQAGTHKGFDSGHQRAWVALVEKRKRIESPQMICDRSRKWDQNQ